METSASLSASMSAESTKASEQATEKTRWKAFLARFGRSSLVGIIATILDFAVLEVLVRAVGFSPSVAKVFSLAVGTSTQFVGSRYYAFRAQKGALDRQLKWFVIAEILAYFVTVWVFGVLVRRLGLPMEVANLLSGSIVYFGLSYPLWNWIFKVRPEELETAESKTE